MFLRLRSNDKRPDVPQGGSIDTSSTEEVEVVEGWIKEGFNVGLRLHGRTVIDFDDGKESARAFYQPELCTVIVETRRGIHFHFSGETVPRKFQHGDIKSGGNAYVVYPPSSVDGFLYTFRRNDALQPFPSHLFPERVVSNSRKEIHDVTAYVMSIESIQGRNGSGGLVRAIARCRDAGLSESEATILLMEWNQSPVVVPPWSHKELSRAITRVFKGAN